MQAFDLKTVLLARHAQHVVLIHFPIALFMIGVTFDLWAQWTKNPFTAGAARYNLVGAAVATPPVLITGALAWLWALGAPRIKGVLLLHLATAIVAGLLMMGIGWLHYRTRPLTRPLPRYRLPIEVLTVALVGVTAHLGGFLSGVNA